MNVRREFWAKVAEGMRVKDGDVERAIGALTPKQREVVLLRLRGFKQDEMAGMLGIHQSRVSRRLKAASDNLAGLLLTINQA